MKQTYKRKLEDIVKKSDKDNHIIPPYGCYSMFGHKCWPECIKCGIQGHVELSDSSCNPNE